MEDRLTVNADWISGLAAAGALVISIIALLLQRRQNAGQLSIQERMTRIEEARRLDEIAAAAEAQRASAVADVRVVSFDLERPNGAQASDKVSITIVNHGPAEARGIDVAVLESEDRVAAQRLGDLAESTNLVGGHSAESPLGYYQIPWELPIPRPVAHLAPGQELVLPFWLRHRAYGQNQIRVEWSDDRGPQVAKCAVAFNLEARHRY